MRRMQISAICESSAVVSSSGARFASSRSDWALATWWRCQIERRGSFAFDLTTASSRLLRSCVRQSLRRGRGASPVNMTAARARETRDILQAGEAKEEFRDSAPIASRKCSRRPEDEAGKLHPAEIVRRHQQMAARRAATVRQVGQGWFRPVRD